MALVTDARLLVLDEPTVGLDVEARRDFWRVLRAAAAAGKTVNSATHYLDEADANADRASCWRAARSWPTAPRPRSRRASASEPSRHPAGHRPPSCCGCRECRRPSATASGPARLSDSDAALRALLTRYAHARDVDVTGAGLEQAFLELTKESESPPSPTPASSCCAPFAASGSSSWPSGSPWPSTS